MSRPGFRGKPGGLCNFPTPRPKFQRGFFHFQVRGLKRKMACPKTTSRGQFPPFSHQIEHLFGPKPMNPLLPGNRNQFFFPGPIRPMGSNGGIFPFQTPQLKGPKCPAPFLRGKLFQTPVPFRGFFRKRQKPPYGKEIGAIFPQIVGLEPFPKPPRFLEPAAGEPPNLILPISGPTIPN